MSSNYYAPSAGDISRIAHQLLRQAIDSAPAVEVVEPSNVSSALPIHPALSQPLRSAASAAQPMSIAEATGLPLSNSKSAPTVAELPSPATLRSPSQIDLGGIRRFVEQMRGSYLGSAAHVLPGTVAKSTPAVPAPSAGSDLQAYIPLDVDTLRRDFPILSKRVHGKQLIWLDNAATTHKPQAVIDAIARFYSNDNSNIHRAAHALAARATDAYESARCAVQEFLGAARPEEVIFVRGCTEGVNLVANIIAPTLGPGDEIVLTELEHHANIVPWQMVAERTGAVIRVAPIDDSGDVILEGYQQLLGPRTRMVAVSHASNSLGTILPVASMTRMAKAHGAMVLVDGAQSVSHFPVDVRRIGCDFYVFSGHKVFGPTGIGAVYATSDSQQSLPPWQGGGNMIQDVTFDRTTYNHPPAKFEAGTPNIADAIGLAVALDYVTRIGRDRIAAYEHTLLEYATSSLQRVPGLRLIGTAPAKVAVLSFVIEGRDPMEIGRALDREGIAIRAGHHCAQPSLRHFGLEASLRASLAFYNSPSEIDQFVEVLRRISVRHG
jgi:cysteine desulfurase / selenocysteine lyase